MVGVEADGGTAVEWGNPLKVTVPGFRGLYPWAMAEVDLGLKMRMPEGVSLEVRLAARWREAGMYVVAWNADPGLVAMCSSSGKRVPEGSLEFEVDVVERRVVPARFLDLSKGELKGGEGV